jgi:hypothetical protein
MRAKRELSAPDLEVDPKPLTPEEKEAISAFIKADKLKRRKPKTQTSRPHGKRPRKHPFSEANLSPDR